jgi:glutathione S-transferase
MKLYYSPLACSLASRIAVYEAEAETTFVEVDAHTKTTSDGADFRAINPLGLVPTLVMDDGSTLTENAAILQYIADRFPNASLAPRDPAGRSRLHQWLSFIGTELHKALYVPLLTPSAPEGAKAFALSKAQTRLSWVATMLDGRDYALGAFSVADAYLFAVLNWSRVTPVDLTPWPTITNYQQRLMTRPAVARAFSEERQLFAAEQARHRKEDVHARPSLPSTRDHERA